mgnify:CR=1 FL=1
MKKPIYFITMDEAFEIVKRWEINKNVNRHLFIAMENEKICAIDNTSGECYAEDFITLEEAVKWLFDLA